MEKGKIKGTKDFVNLKTAKIELTKQQIGAISNLDKDLEIAQYKLEKGIFPAFPVTAKQRFVFSFLRSDFDGIKDNTLFFMKTDGEMLTIPNVKAGYYSYTMKSNTGNNVALSHISENKKQVFCGKNVWVLREGEFECYPHKKKQDSKKVQSTLYNIDSGNKELEKAVLGDKEKKRQFVITLIIVVIGGLLVVGIMFPDILAGFMKATADNVAPVAVDKSQEFVAQNLTGS